MKMCIECGSKININDFGHCYHCQTVKRVLEKFSDYAKWEEVHLIDFLYGMVSGHPLYQEDYKEALKRILDNWGE